MERHTSNHLETANNAPAAPQPQKVKRQSKKQDLSRRRFVAMAGAGLGAVAVVVAAIEVGTHVLGSHGAPTSAQNAAGNGVLAKAASVPPNQAVTFPIPNQRNPGLLIHLQNGNFVAYDSTCTHVGCAVKYNPQDQMLECPCHAAVFDPAKGAAVVTGPATTPLKSINIKVNPNGTITTA